MPSLALTLQAFSGVDGGGNRAGGGGGSYEAADREAMRQAAEKRAADNQLRGVQGSKPGLSKSPDKPSGGGGRGETDYMDKGTWN